MRFEIGSECELEHTVHAQHTQKKNTSSTNTIKPNVKQEMKTEKARARVRVWEWESGSSKKNQNPVKQKIHRCTKFDEMWRALTYRMIFTLLHQNDSQNPFHRMKMCVCVLVLCNNEYIYTSDIYLGFFRHHRRRCCCCHCRFPVISRDETEHFIYDSVATRKTIFPCIVCGVCCANF